jgi:hypothetical protein
MPTGKHSPANNRPGLEPSPDSPHPSEPDRFSPDRLVPAGWLLGIALTVVGLCFLTLTYDTLRGVFPPPAQAAPLLHAIGLNELALVPSGRPERRPALPPSPIDWRYGPDLPRQAPELIPLLKAEQFASPQGAAP